MVTGMVYKDHCLLNFTMENFVVEESLEIQIELEVWYLGRLKFLEPNSSAVVCPTSSHDKKARETSCWCFHHQIPLYPICCSAKTQQDAKEADLA